MNLLESYVEKKKAASEQHPSFKSGDTLKVHVRIKDGNNERIQIVQGICIARHNNGFSSTFRVRKVVDDEGIERVFLLHSPIVTKIEVVRVGRVRRAKLYYLRNLRGKAARIRAENNYLRK
ncbi:50S ribosomal protein L19 [Candidatus Fokinia solitaria]|uniref:Large ribosomal subunit protein bL19 n=1 Tax=Candidatus Fokinia solitaria TaxID=1802984 RepID=A0A2U8BSF5_9RICK|nr:50S ribosomal protein L19 [Candidatus Fokinia solitaria]AWD33267.1 50S ribosomal protein L19 [Candidatus Fokinia solitaria]